MRAIATVVAALLAVAVLPGMTSTALAAKGGGHGFHASHRGFPASHGSWGHGWNHGGHQDFRGWGNRGWNNWGHQGAYGWGHNGWYFGRGHDRDDWDHHGHSYSYPRYYSYPGYGSAFYGNYAPFGYSYPAPLPPGYYVAPPAYYVAPPAYYAPPVYGNGGSNLGFNFNFD